MTFNQLDDNSFLRLGERGGRVEEGEGKERVEEEDEVGEGGETTDDWEEEPEGGLECFEGGGVLTVWGLAGGADLSPTLGLVGEREVRVGVRVREGEGEERMNWGEAAEREGVGEAPERGTPEEVLGRIVAAACLEGKRGGRWLLEGEGEVEREVAS